MTFSLVARDASGAFGSVICSSSPAVAARCVHLRDGVGAVHSQNVTDPRLGPAVLDAMERGSWAAEALAVVTHGLAPEVAAWRQLLVVDAASRTAIHSGPHALGTVGDFGADGAVAAGNLLASADVPRRMVEEFHAASGDVERRLYAALRAGVECGGEAGPVRSAGLAVVRRAGWRVTDLRVDWDDDPVARLGVLLEVWLPQRDAYVLRGLDPASSPGYGSPVTSADPSRTAALKKAVQSAVDARLDELVELAERIHAHPELAWEETQASSWVAQALEHNGFDVEPAAFGLPTAVRAGFGHGSRRVGLLAEYDALPGLGHACGHNLIAAVAVGAAVALTELADELDLTVEVYGCPAEEGGGGKIEMLDAGAFAGLDLAMLAHPAPVDVARAQPRTVAHEHIAYEGRTAHAGAYPDLGINAADAMVIAQVAIGLLRQQLPDGTRVHGIVTNGGQAPNAIPGLVEGRWYVRAETRAELADLMTRVNRCFEAGALASGASLSITQESKPYSEFRTDERALAAYRTNAAALGRVCSTDSAAARMATASTDMGNVSLVVPAIHPYVGVDAGGAANHEPGFTAACRGRSAERMLRDSAIALAQTAVDVFHPGCRRS